LAGAGALKLFTERVSTTSLLDLEVVAVVGFTDVPFVPPLVLPGFDMLKRIMRGRPPASQSAKSSHASIRKVR
jgi:hypothetical protein